MAIHSWREEPGGGTHTHTHTHIHTHTHTQNLEEEMAIHSSILARIIPWREEPGGLYSPWGHNRIRHDLVTKHQQIHTPKNMLRLPWQSSS